VRLLFVGDVVGRPGREIVRRAIPQLRRDLELDLVIANAENSAGGAGVSPTTARELLDAGCDVLTGGNHSWDRPEVVEFIDRCPALLRPANFPDGTPGRGSAVVSARDGTPVAVVNLQGRVLMDPLDDPFRIADELVAALAGTARVIVVDFHAEATSEKLAMGWHLDGRVSGVLGTHTHVATADERVLPGGTAYITDAGMTGPMDSVIGVRKEDAVRRFRTQRPVRFTTAEGDVRLHGVVLDVDPATGRALAIRRLRWPDTGAP